MTSRTHAAPPAGGNPEEVLDAVFDRRGRGRRRRRHRDRTRRAPQGLVSALIVLAIIVGIMQLEGHVLQPLLLAVPLLAVLNSGIRSLRSDADRHTRPQDVHTSEPEATGPDEPDMDPASDAHRLTSLRPQQ